MADYTDKKKIDITQGSLWKNIIIFSIPLMCSQVLEILFNMTDVAVVGRFASYEALGSVGSTTLLVTLFTGLLIGMGSGINVRAAQQLGAGDDKKTARTVHTSLLLCIIIGVILSAICVGFARTMLTMLNTKEELIDGAVLYFRIYGLGMPALAVFNFGNGVLSAKGETNRPLIYLSCGGVVNIILNLIFVIGCGMAAEGVAIASIIAQYISAGLTVKHMFGRNDSCRLRMDELKIDPVLAKAVLVLGLPAGLQNSIFALANLFIQTGVNSFDAVMVSGNSAAANADALMFNVMAAIYTGCATFMGQNLGAGRHERVLKSYFISLFYSALVGLIGGGLLIIFGRQFLSVFTTETAVVDAGLQRLHVMGFSFFISAFMDCTIAACRGIGKSIVPTFIVIMGSCIFRIIWVYTIFAYFHTVPSLYLVYSCSWTITAIAEIAYFTVSYRKLMHAQRAA